jgi:pSer/pThr/pTyr-binding forkhead associated (FHA) protein
MTGAAAASPHARTAAELKAQIDAERAGSPFLIYRDGDGRHRVHVLHAGQTQVTLGRRPSAGLPLPWDDEVSRLHAELIRTDEEWTVSDDGLSLNGSFVNGEPIRGKRRLRDGDALRVGETVLVFRDPSERESKATAPSDDVREAAQLTEAQKRVLAALCRPFGDAAAFVTPPTNEQIAQELYLSVDAVKKHLRALFEKFGIAHLPQNEKRARLVERAFAAGFVPERPM